MTENKFSSNLIDFVSKYIEVIMTFLFISIQTVFILSLLIHMEAVSSSNVATDHTALLEIKSKISDDPQSVFKSWNDSLPFCQWQGLTCGRRHQRVTILNLNGTGITGSLSPYLGNLSFLKYIILDNNYLHGSIPPEISQLFRLQAVSLQNNSFTGEIPANISSCSKLRHINFSRNMLSGKIPNFFSSLIMMGVLALDLNNFTGGIPPSIGNLTSLKLLALNGCPLGGSIPASFNQLKKLQLLFLGKSSLVGVFPSFLFDLPMLELLSVTGNQLHGSLPSNLCLTQPNLRILEVGENHFSGFLPLSISNCSELERFDVSVNEFRGEIAIDFGKLQFLSEVSLGMNSFESKRLNSMGFFDSFSNCSNLVSLDLGYTNLRGVFPNSLGNFSSKLQYLSLYSNYISGRIPSTIGNLLGLTTLNLGVNNFTDMIPESIGNLQNLVALNLENNNFFGVIPISLGNLSFLTELGLGENKLEGIIPSTIGSCKNLIYLDLYRNNLRGSIPKELFQLSSLSIILDLSQNNLSGVLPREIGNLKVLGQLDLSENHLSGELPNSLSTCISLESLNLSGNVFYGSVPEALSNIRALEYVDLSRNNFSGRIPTYMQQIPLKQLDLSYNNFEGEVPVKGVFANTSAITIIENNRLCGGVPELNLTKCTTTVSGGSRRKKLTVRVVVAILLSSVVAGLALLSFFLFYCCSKKKRDKISNAILNKSFEKISYGRLFKATKGFSPENLIGVGGFASVYKGVLDENGITVAIKVLNLQLRGGLKSFMAECDALRNIRHRNLVKVITSCSSLDSKGNDFKALVYDFMPNGSLESWLYAIHHRLDFVQRVSIIKDVACALEYLHFRCGNVVVHCDLKPSNILLDGDMVAHVGDFGLAKILSLGEVSNGNKSSSSVIKGTIGYAPPEYGLGNEVSTKGDIYSYGILLLEILTGKKPVDAMFKEGLSLHSYARSALAEGFLLQIVDPVLLNESVSEQSLLSLVKIGVQCSSESPQDRMDIGTVVHELFLITTVTTNS